MSEPSNKGKKNDVGKPPLELIPREALEGMARVLAFGAEKYAPDNWRGGFAWRRLIGAGLRHLVAFGSGEDLDPESGLPHVDHALCCLAFLSAHVHSRLGTDDRWRPAPPAVVLSREALEVVTPEQFEKLKTAFAKDAEPNAALRAAFLRNRERSCKTCGSGPVCGAQDRCSTFDPSTASNDLWEE